MAAANWIMYDRAKLGHFDGLHDLPHGSYKMTLHGSSYTPSLAHQVYADVSASELVTANNYVNGGQALTMSAADASGTDTLSAAADTAWPATGGPISARYAVIRRIGTFNALVDPLWAYNLLDATPANVTAAAGETLTVARPTAGFFTVTGGRT